jgi:hypothetical protein
MGGITQFDRQDAGLAKLAFLVRARDSLLDRATDGSE